MKYILDTNICIYLIKRKPASVIQRLQKIELSNVGISAVTLSELEYGVEKSQRVDQNRLALIQFTAPFEILPYGDSAAQCYGSIRSRLETQGLPIGPLDMLIAAHAIALDCILVTNNTREFDRIENFRTEDWTV